MTTTLQEYLLLDYRRGVIDHHLRVAVDVRGDRVNFYIHPENDDGATLDFEVLGNSLLPAACVLSTDQGT